MTKAEEAFREARRRIASAYQTMASSLDLSSLIALEELPEEISDLYWLSTLRLQGTRIRDIDPIAPLEKLRQLNLGNTRVSSIEALWHKPDLSLLSLWNTNVEGIKPLFSLRNLTWLDLGMTTVEDVSYLLGPFNLEWLNLRGTRVRDLFILSQSSSLTKLSLMDTRVSDIEPLEKMKRLETLILDGSAVMDFQPLRGLSRLRDRPSSFVENSDYVGLSFRGCDATKISSRIAEIAQIEDATVRFTSLFDYLDEFDHRPLPPQPAIPDDAPSAPTYLVPDEGPITALPDPPSGGDEDQEGLRQDLVVKAQVLVEVIGTSNELAPMRASAEHYRKQIDRDLAAIRLNRLYSAANTLRVAYEAEKQAQAQARHSDQLPPKAAAALTDLIETHALFFMGFPDAAKLHRQMMDGLTGARRPELVPLAEPIVQALEGKATVLDPEEQQAMADDLAAARGAGPSAEIGEARVEGRIRNLVLAVARKAYGAAKSGTKKVMDHDIVAFMLGNQTAIGAILRAAQDHVPIWFNALVKFLERIFLN